MPQPRQRLGQRGETLVADRLARAGYTILARNWRHGTLGELDIVARRGAEIVFVEVRTRRGPLDAAIEWALASVNERKRARLARLAQTYLDVHGLEGAAWRIDVVAVACQGSRLVMEVITDAVGW
jgi:putative endonuclease